MNNNFLKKHLTTILIIVLCVITITTIIILSRKDKHDITQKSELPILQPKNEEIIHEDQNIDTQSHKQITKIKLPTSPNPHEIIEKWKSEKIIDSSSLIKESDYKWIVDGDNYTLTQTIETKDKIHRIFCDSDYQEKLTQWKNQCSHKPGDIWSSNKLGDKYQFGKTKLYTNNCRYNIYSYGHNKYIEPKRYDNGIYYVIVHPQWKFLSITQLTVSIIGDKELNLDIWRDWRFDDYYDKTPPPQKPDITKPLT